MLTITRWSFRFAAFLHLGRLARHDLLGPARGVAPVRGHLVLVVLLELRVVVLVGDDVQERELDEQAHGLAEVRHREFKFSPMTLFGALRAFNMHFSRKGVMGNMGAPAYLQGAPLKATEPCYKPRSRTCSSCYLMGSAKNLRILATASDTLATKENEISGKEMWSGWILVFSSRATP